MGIFDVFKKKKGNGSEMDRLKRIIEVKIDCKTKFDTIKKAYDGVKTNIEMATDVKYEDRVDLFKQVQSETVAKLAELKTKIAKYVEDFKVNASSSDVIDMMKMEEEVGKMIDKVNGETLSNGPSGPAGPQ